MENRRCAGSRPNYTTQAGLSLLLHAEVYLPCLEHAHHCMQQTVVQPETCSGTVLVLCCRGKLPRMPVMLFQGLPEPTTSLSLLRHRQHAWLFMVSYAAIK